ncbi:MAG: hypothetical protein R6U29_13610, partial [Desulfosudaceae bacterium]
INLEMTMTRKFIQNCVCKHCGNESEMEITCSLTEVTAAEEKKADPGREPAAEEVKVKGRGVCAHCGSEADMWLEM